MAKIEITENTRYYGTYRDIPFEIQRFEAFEHTSNKYSWCHYIMIYDTQVTSQELELPKEYFTYYGTQLFSDAPWVHGLEFHGGCTYYRIDREDYLGNLLKIGCDYQHAWDVGRDYNINDIVSEVEDTIDSLYVLFPNIVTRDQLLTDFRSKFPKDAAMHRRFDVNGQPMVEEQ